MINTQHARFDALTAVLLLSTVMLITIDESQNSVLAQNITSTLLPPHLPAQDSTSTPTTSAQDSTSTPTTSAIEPSGSDDESSSSNDSDNNDDSNDDESSGSSGSNDGNDDDDNGDDGDSQDTSTSSEEVEQEDETEDDFGQINSLLEQIRNRVSAALSTTGIAVP